MAQYTAEDLLEAREKRAAEIAYLLKQYKRPVLAMRVNYPGLEKTNATTRAIIREMSLELSELFGPRIFFKSLRQGAEGPVFLAVLEGEGTALKRAAIDLEEKHPLGRCVDIDIYTGKDRSISRQELGYSGRKCYLCSEDAHYCVRSRRHHSQAVIEYIENIFNNYVRQNNS